MAKEKKNSNLNKEIEEDIIIEKTSIENKGEDVPMSNQNRDVDHFDIDTYSQKASVDRKNSKLKISYRLIGILVALIVVICIVQTIIDVKYEKTIEILGNVNQFFQYAVTTILGYLFATKKDGD